ncbi:dihydroxyacetone kinase subunit L [Nocardiopsis sp. CNT-189]|uniref:dihydroxyacetone kinase subunit DhaL n=1 Tax=Nocardiopsis oceanisediminis TaxID=2816862 RepID=UPI003B3375F9
MDAFTAGQATAWIGAAAEAVAEDKERLTELDAAIGDGDHGANMDRGLGAAREALAVLDAAGPGEVLVKTGMTLISKVGGASGPLYGSFFRTTGKNLEGAEAGLAGLAAALRTGLEAVQRMGAAQPGDKTMVDALSPAVTALEQAAEKGAALAEATRNAADAAYDGAQATIPLQARKGRASYLGERSIGHEDPGAASAVLIFRSLAEATAT